MSRQVFGRHIRKILVGAYFGCAIFNALLIGPMNWASGVSRIMTDLNDEFRQSRSVFDKTLLMVLVPTYSLVGFGLVGLVKAAVYSGAGPLGTYRILLACHNYNKTRDLNWLDTLFRPFTSTHERYTPYIMWPFGIASWKPIKG